MMTPIYNSNTVDGGLTNSMLAEIVTSLLTPLVAPLAKCCTVQTNAKSLRSGTLVAPYVSATGNAQSGAVTNFESSGNSTLVGSSIAAAFTSRIAHLDRAELNLGMNISMLIPAVVSSFASDLWALWCTQVSAANFAAASATVAAASFDATHVSTLAQSVASGPRALLLTTQCQQNVQAILRLGNDNVWRAPGFDGGVFEVTTTGVSDNAQAIATTPLAMVGAIAKPESLAIPGAASELNVTPITIPGLGEVAYFCHWRSRAARSEWISIEAICGFAPGNPTALRYVAST